MDQPYLVDDELLFVPAAGIAEAAARIFALTGAVDPGSRGPKRSLHALANSLGVDADLAETNAVVGARIASRLQVPWRQEREYEGLQVTLDGLNLLLRGASRWLWAKSRQRTVDSGSYADVLRAFPTFKPAPDKQDAVNRLSDLAGVPRDALGPGGKEHKVTFESVAALVAPDLLLDADAQRTKHSLVAALCERLSVPWLETSGSTGQSVTLEGLNLLLAGVERRREVASSGWSTPLQEAAALLRVLRDGLPEQWDGRATVEQMRADGSRNWRQMEWPGWFFEEQVGALLNEAYPTPAVGGPRRAYGATVFDYASPSRVWDAKAHTVAERLEPSGREVQRGTDSAILNDVGAITDCLSEQGLGFLILDGGATFDETGRFDSWHRAFSREGRTSVSYRPNSEHRRRRKAAFVPLALRAVWIPDIAALDAGISGGWMTVARQGSQQARSGQAHGAERADKFQLKVHRSAAWVVALEQW